MSQQSRRPLCGPLSRSAIEARQGRPHQLPRADASAQLTLASQISVWALLPSPGLDQPLEVYVVRVVRQRAALCPGHGCFEGGDVCSTGVGGYMGADPLPLPLALVVYI